MSGFFGGSSGGLTAGERALLLGDNITSLTTDTTLTDADSHKAFNNTGATAIVEVDLPVAAEGIVLTFRVTDADGFRLAPNGTDDIYYGGTVGVDEVLESTVIGSSITLAGGNNGKWTTDAAMGEWQFAEPGFSAEAQQFFDRLGTPESETYADQDAAFIDALVDGGVWTNLDVLYVFATTLKATGQTNLKSASFTVTETGTPTWTQDEGYAGSGVNYLDTNLNPSTAGGNFVQNDAGIFVYTLTAGAIGGSAVTYDPGSGHTVIWPRDSASLGYFAVNDPSGGPSFPSTDGSGLFLAQRTASNLSKIYRNDVELGSTGGASAALRNSNIIAAGNANQVAILGAGGSLSAGERTALYNACVTLLTARGVI